MNERRLLMIPGPIEFEPEVLRALGQKTLSHVDPDFIASFSRALALTKEVFAAPSGQPFVIAGSGTLAMEMAVANVVEPGDGALVVDTGYFSERMGKILDRHGAAVTRVGAPIGGAPSLEDVERALAAGAFKVMTITHVDTSTGVLAPVEDLVKLARDRGVITIVDGVCSVGGEALAMDAWGVDVALSASQKALGTPPGLAIHVAGPRAMAAWRARKAKVQALYLDFAEWLPIMEAYGAGKPSYFATPAVNLVVALEASLRLLVAEGMEARVARHGAMAAAFREGFRALGLRPLPLTEALAAHTLSALYYPDGVDAGLVGLAREEGVVLAGGLHPEARAKYFRVGHMGAVSAGDVLATGGAVERALARAGHKGGTAGAGVAAAQAQLGRGAR